MVPNPPRGPRSRHDQGGAVTSFGVLAGGTNGALRGGREHLALQTRLTVASGGGQEYLLGRRKTDDSWHATPGE